MDNFPPFVARTFAVQYIVWVTNYPMELVIGSSAIGGMSDLKRHLTFPVTLISNSTWLTVYYVNHYYARNTKTMFPERIPTTCPLSECLRTIESITISISRLNRFFWRARDWREESIRLTAKFSKGNPYRVINLTSSFSEFMALWIFDGIENMTIPNPLGIFTFASSRRLLYISDQISAKDVILLGWKNLNFLSYYAVGRHISTFGELISPFDMTTWTMLAFSFILVSIFLGRLTTRERTVFDSSGPLVSVGIMLEASTLGGVEFNLLGKRGNVGFRLILLLWVFPVGTVLRNWYKTYFTFEMIVPAEITAPWRSFVDVEGFKLIAGLSTLLEEYEMGGSMSSGNFLFYIKLRQELGAAMRYAATSIKFRGYSRIANVWLEGTYDGQTQERNVSDRLVVPLLDPDGFLKNVTQCETKIAFIDKAENVRNLVGILNDYYRHKEGGKRRTYFRKGVSDEETFMGAPMGWEMNAFSYNFVYERLKASFSSGIYNHWREWYDRVRPQVMSYNMTNNTNANSVVTGGEFESKMWTGFYISGIFLVLSGAVLLWEIIKNNFGKL